MVAPPGSVLNGTLDLTGIRGVALACEGGNGSVSVRDIMLIAMPVSGGNGTIVPLYTYPTHPSWDAIVNAKHAHPAVTVIAVVNPSNGPGAAVDSNYTNGIAKLHNAAIKVLGYVHTSWTNRPTSEVRADMDRWKSFYPQIDGIFDEMANTAGKESYYTSLTNYAKTTQGFTFTVGNPGADTISSYVGTVDVILIYERANLPDLNSLGGWHANYDRSNFGIIRIPCPWTPISSTMRSRGSSFSI